MNIRRLSLAETTAILLKITDSVSQARAAILVDQVRGLLRSQHPERLISLVGAQPENATSGAMFLLATKPEKADTITILHAGGLGQTDISTDCRSDDCTAIWSALAAEVGARQTYFVQWATDPIAAATEPNTWMHRLGFRRIGTLEYLAKDLEAPTDEPTVAVPALSHLRVQVIDQRDETARSEFERIVQETYRDSLDCPKLETFRSVTQTLADYRSAESFSPELWFLACTQDQTGNDSTDDVAGCLILARHQNESGSQVMELVYMGILPEHRGQKYGEQLMQIAENLCHREQTRRLILAVDETNTPARDAYHRFGMQPLFRETVWARMMQPVA